MPLIGDILGYLSAGSASKKAQEGYLNAIHGILGATESGQNVVGAAGTNAADIVAGSTTAANNVLGDVGTKLESNIQPYLQAGAKGVNDLSNIGPFSFTLGDWQNDPGFKFQMQQGTEAINNAASSRGMLQSGNTLKDLTAFGQGLANTYYNQAFGRALNTFGANVGLGTTLADIGLRGSNLYQGSQLTTSSEIAKNLINAGLFGGESGIDVAKFIASLGIRGAEGAAGLAVGKGDMAAAGTAGKYKAIGQGVEDIAGLATKFL